MMRRGIAHFLQMKLVVCACWLYFFLSFHLNHALALTFASVCWRHGAAMEFCELKKTQTEQQQTETYALLSAFHSSRDRCWCCCCFWCDCPYPGETETECRRWAINDVSGRQDDWSTFETNVGYYNNSSSDGYQNDETNKWTSAWCAQTYNGMAESKKDSTFKCGNISIFNSNRSIKVYAKRMYITAYFRLFSRCLSLCLYIHA